MAAAITSITGLQNLTNLQEFRADYNSLTTVNLSGLTNLQIVDISDNEIPGSSTHSLTSVNLSGSTAIRTLRLDDSDFSAGIPNISALSQLEVLDLDGCDISGTIDVSDFSLLEEVDFSNNLGITSIIISDDQPINDFDAHDCGLTETSVDDILVTLSNSIISSGFVDIAGATNAFPSATGFAAKITLRDDKSWNVLVREPLLPFDVTADWSLTTPAVVDEATFRVFLESGQDGAGRVNSLTNVNITAFSLVGNRLQCNLSANNSPGADLYLGSMNITSVNSLGNMIDRIDELRLEDNSIASVDGVIWPYANYIYLGHNSITSVNNVTWPSGLQSLYLYENQIVNFNPTVALPSGLQYLNLDLNQIVTFNPSIALPSSLDILSIEENNIVIFNPTIPLPTELNALRISDNQMTTAGYTASEPWANAMSVIPNRGGIYAINNLDPMLGTNLRTILIAKGWDVYG
jgi:Leucine-rich repeat (LRR) protein